MQVEQAKKLKDLQKENAQLRRAIADLTLEKQVLKDGKEIIYRDPKSQIRCFGEPGGRRVAIRLA